MFLFNSIVHLQIDAGLAWWRMKEDVSDRDNVSHRHDSSSHVRHVLLLLWLSAREQDTWL